MATNPILDKLKALFSTAPSTTVTDANCTFVPGQYSYPEPEPLPEPLFTALMPPPLYTNATYPLAGSTTSATILPYAASAAQLQAMTGMGYADPRGIYGSTIAAQQYNPMAQQAALLNQLAGQQLQGLSNAGLQYMQNALLPGLNSLYDNAMAVAGAKAYDDAFNSQNAAKIAAGAPDAFMTTPEGEYDEVHASVPLDFCGRTLIGDRFPELYTAALRGELEKQGIQFDISMGAPPTMEDLRSQILGHWSMWQDPDKQTFEVTQRMPRLELRNGKPGASTRDAEEEFEAEMRPAMERLVKALQNKDKQNVN